jgi:hypothetical protein
MIHDQKTVYISASNELNIVGANVIDSERYISPNLSGVYTLPSSNLNILYSSNANFLKYLVNTIPYRATTTTQIHSHLYQGTVVENPSITIMSHGLPFVSVFGVYLDESTTCAVVDIVNERITTSNTIKNHCVFNYNLGIEYSSKAVSKGQEFIYFENCIIQQYVNLKYSTITHPLFLNHFRPLYNSLNNNLGHKFKLYNNTNNLISKTTITLQPLKMLFSINGSAWYIYNTGTSMFTSIIPSDTYFTFNELNTVGTPYQTYTNIPLSKFTDTFGADITKIQVLSNGWILPRYIKHTLYNDSLDSSNFIWVVTTATAKRTIYVGNI